jgi:hypothetical protein
MVMDGWGGVSVLVWGGDAMVLHIRCGCLNIIIAKRGVRSGRRHSDGVSRA